MPLPRRSLLCQGFLFCFPTSVLIASGLSLLHNIYLIQSCVKTFEQMIQRVCMKWQGGAQRKSKHNCPRVGKRRRPSRKLLFLEGGQVVHLTNPSGIFLSLSAFPFPLSFQVTGTLFPLLLKNTWHLLLLFPSSPFKVPGHLISRLQ